MKAMACLTFLSLTMSLISCSTGGIRSSDGDAAAVSAPSALAGNTYRVTVESGSGVFASTGTFTIAFLSSQPWYITQGDGVNFFDSWGMYIYSASGASGTVKMDDSKVSKVDLSFTFNTDISGTFVVTETADGNTTLSGTFTEL